MPGRRAGSATVRARADVFAEVAGEGAQARAGMVGELGQGQWLMEVLDADKAHPLGETDRTTGKIVLVAKEPAKAGKGTGHGDGCGEECWKEETAPLAAP